MKLKKKGKYVDWACKKNVDLIKLALESAETMKGAAKMLGLNYNTFYRQAQKITPDSCAKFEKPYIKPMALLDAIKSSSNMKEVAQKLGVQTTSANDLVTRNYPQYKAGLLTNRSVTQEEIDAVKNSRLTVEQTAEKMDISFGRVRHIKAKIKRMQIAEMENQSAAFQNLTCGS